MSKIKVDAISTFRCPCGVGKYYEELAYPLSQLVDLKTNAEELHVKEEDTPIYNEPKLDYTRNWNRNKDYTGLISDILFRMPDVVSIQHESAMYNEKMFDDTGNFLKMLDKLHENGIKTVITLHNVPQFDANYKNDWYKKCNSHFIVTNKLMQQELKKWEPTAESTIIPLGTTIFEPTETKTARKILKLPEDTYIITQTGFYGYDKGMLPLIEAMPEILEKIPNALLVLAGSLHPLAPKIHKEHLLACFKTAFNLNLKDKVLFTGKFLNEEDLSMFLSASDIVAVNHQYVFGLYSSSASAHRALNCGKPILMNVHDVRLSEFKDGVHCLKTTNTDIAENIFKLYKDKEFSNKIVQGAKKYSQETSYENIAQKHLDVYEQVIKK